MSNLMMIHELCDLCEVQNQIIDALSTRLTELGDDKTMHDELEEADDRFRDIILNEI